MRHVSVLMMLVLAGAGARALTADELIAKNIEARGGREKLKAIQSMKTTGKVTMGGDDGVLEMAFTSYSKRPGSLRRERTIQGLTAVTAFDGNDGWTLQPFGGRREPEKLPPDVVKSLRDDGDVDGPLVDYKQKGHVVEYLGTEDVDGTLAHKLKLTLKSGNIEYVYLDPDYFLEIRVVSIEKVRGVEEEGETDFGNYELVDGVYMPFSVESGARGGPKGYKVTVEKVEVNVPVDDAMFHFPAPAAGGAR
ncbi:MAG: hypothetical protein U0166_21025 [Acidobacteriota bacterium]